jgi:hypothetical protein
VVARPDFDPPASPLLWQIDSGVYPAYCPMHIQVSFYDRRMKFIIYLHLHLRLQMHGALVCIHHTINFVFSFITLEKYWLLQFVLDTFRAPVSMRWSVILTGFSYLSLGLPRKGWVNIVQRAMASIYNHSTIHQYKTYRPIVNKAYLNKTRNFPLPISRKEERRTLIYRQTTLDCGNVRQE